MRFESTNVALKEWASVVAALEAGRQILLLRKGGIVEGRRGFELRHQQFLFFPTFEHQHADLLKPGFAVPEPPREGVLVLRSGATVDSLLTAPPLPEDLAAIDSLHVWNDRFIRQRYAYRPDLPLRLVLLRVWRLREPVEVPLRDAYAGCKSWVNLTEEISLTDRHFVLDEEQFLRERDRITHLLAMRGPVNMAN